MKAIDTEESETQATGADGQAMMLSSSLMAFVANNGGQGGFHLSDWLQSLDGGTLFHLRERARMALDNPEPKAEVMSDILAVVIYAVSIERQAAEVTLSLEQLGQHIDMLHNAAALERLRRKGLLSYEVISIDPEAENRLFFPDEAASLADEVRREFIWGMP
jgi:hypothetical protein